MKRYIIHIMTILLASLGVACQDVPDVTPQQPAIVLNVSGGTMRVISRAEDMADNDAESAVQHIDVMIFNDAPSDEDKTLMHSERFTTSDPNGQIKLGVDINAIQPGKKYWIYVVANSTASASTFAQIGNVKALLALKQQDNNVHLTATGLQQTSQYFLMDGVGYKGDSEPEYAGAVAITNEKITDVVRLNVKLRRAAAKIVVKLMSDSKMQFDPTIENSTFGYYMRNLPYSTRVVDNGVIRECQELETTHETTSPYSNWIYDDNNNIIGLEIIAYTYSHKWESNNSFKTATNLLVDIPARYTNDNDQVIVLPNNYYQVPLTQNFEFDRNHYYEVQALVAAPGAEDVSEPIVVQNLKYSTQPWTERTINIGNVDGPQYLKVNLDELKMYNANIDATSLQFTSSSPVTITVSDCYYIDKFGVKRTINASSYGISGSTDRAALAGKITVQSDVPTNNTIRYFTLNIKNETGQTETVTVEQYPLVYIVNVLGHYSYRDDFKSNSNSQPTTYIHKGDRISSVSLGSYNSSTKQWSYTRNNNAGRGFWSSKVVTQDYAEGSGAKYEGRSKIQYYTWGSSGNTPSLGSNTDNPGNARMYHVRITATSSEYVLGVPRMVKNTSADVPYEYTDEGDDNAKLVSPSFMTASRLSKVDIQNYGSGLTNDERRYSMSRDHCAWYVEVDRNGNVYDNWRLPTAAELKIIMDLQGTANESADAIDYLLDADFYMSASGLVYNRKNSDSSSESSSNKSQWAIRCIRDAYENQ